MNLNFCKSFIILCKNGEIVVKSIGQDFTLLTERVNAWFSPLRILLLSLICGLSFGGLFLGFNQDIYRDVANCYAWYAREFGRGYWNAVPLANLPPLNIFLAGLLVRCGMDAYRALM